MTLMDQGGERCESCGFTLQFLDSVFSAEELRLSQVNDANGILNTAELTVIRAFLHDFQNAFPQLSMVIYLGRLEGRAEVGARETAFWLANRARLHGFSHRQRAASLMLYIDVKTRRAVLTGGYALEAMMDEQDLRVPLLQARPYFLRGDYARGILACLTVTAAMLFRKSATIHTQPSGSR